MTTTNQEPTVTQAQRDQITFNAYVDSGLNASRTAHDQGISPATVRARVRRHSLRLSAARRAH